MRQQHLLFFLPLYLLVWSIFFFICLFFFLFCACFNHALTFRFVFKAGVGAFFYNSVDLDALCDDDDDDDGDCASANDDAAVAVAASHRALKFARCYQRGNNNNNGSNNVNPLRVCWTHRVCATHLLTSSPALSVPRPFAGPVLLISCPANSSV